jgi:hypothetical protein
MQKKKEFLSCYMSYLSSHLIFSLKNYVKNVMYTNRKLPRGKCYIWKRFNLGTTSSFFHVFIHGLYISFFGCATITMRLTSIIKGCVLLHLHNS